MYIFISCNPHHSLLSKDAYAFSEALRPWLQIEAVSLPLIIPFPQCLCGFIPYMGIRCHYHLLGRKGGRKMTNAGKSQEHIEYTFSVSILLALQKSTVLCGIKHLQEIAEKTAV